MKNEKKVIFEDLTDAEVGQLYRAKLAGKAIEHLNGCWDKIMVDVDFGAKAIYRVKPEPEYKTSWLHFAGASTTHMVEMKALGDALSLVSYFELGEIAGALNKFKKLNELVKGGDV